MPKGYLNRESKNLVLILASFTDILDKQIEVQHDKLFVRNMKLARYWLQQSMDRLVKDVETTMLTMIIKELKKLEVVVKYKREAIQEYKELACLDAKVHVDNSDFYDMVEHMLWVCSHCTDDHEGCHMKELLLKYDVPVPGNDECDCPYRLK